MHHPSGHAQSSSKLTSSSSFLYTSPTAAKPPSDPGCTCASSPCMSFCCTRLAVPCCACVAWAESSEGQIGRCAGHMPRTIIEPCHVHARQGTRSKARYQGGPHTTRNEREFSKEEFNGLAKQPSNEGQPNTPHTLTPKGSHSTNQSEQSSKSAYPKARPP